MIVIYLRGAAVHPVAPSFSRYDLGKRPRFHPAHIPRVAIHGCIG
jgi:hypothetical protein